MQRRTHESTHAHAKAHTRTQKSSHAHAKEHACTPARVQTEAVAQAMPRRRPRATAQRTTALASGVAARLADVPSRTCARRWAGGS
eukprot:365847-Chlamydomonas_euryale.AAC.40